MSVGVLRGSHTLVLKGYGMADLATADSGYLAARMRGNPRPQRLTPDGKDSFVSGRQRFTFVRDGSRVVRARVDRVYENTVLTKRP